MKFKNTTDVDMTLRGVHFPSGKAVKVDDASLIEKIAAMPEFIEVKRAKKHDQDAG